MGLLRRVRTLTAGAAVLVLLAGCSTDEPPVAAASAAPDGTVDAVLDGVALRLEVADDPQERATGLMGRESVPAGTGMLFRYDAPVESRYYMYRVPIPLRATFVRDGTVVSTVVMPPCELDDPQACPTYGADGPFDTVVETDPSAPPEPAPGDVLELRG